MHSAASRFRASETWPYTLNTIAVEECPMSRATATSRLLAPSPRRPLRLDLHGASSALSPRPLDQVAQDHRRDLEHEGRVAGVVVVRVTLTQSLEPNLLPEIVVSGDGPLAAEHTSPAISTSIDSVLPLARPFTAPSLPHAAAAAHVPEADSLAPGNSQASRSRSPATATSSSRSAARSAGGRSSSPRTTSTARPVPALRDGLPTVVVARPDTI